MAKGFGIAALVLAILSIFVPVVSLYVVWLSLALATASAFGDRTFTIAVVAICVVNVVFLSPLTWSVLTDRISGLSVLTVVLFLAPAIGLVVSWNRGRSRSTPVQEV